MEEKKKEIGKIVRAIVFSDKDAPEEYVLEEKLRIPVGGEFVEIFSDGKDWRVDRTGFQGEIWINGKTYTDEKSVLSVREREILQLKNHVVTDLVLEQMESADLQWKRMPLSECFPIIRIRKAGEKGEQAEADAEAQISEDDVHEAVIRLEEKEWRLSSVHTVRGIFVNGERVFDSRTLRKMDVICAGDTLFFFNGEALFYSHTVLRGNNLSIHIEERSVKSFFKKHILLQDINLTVEPGNMVLILGGSGAGKTTFVNAVTGYEKAKAQILQSGVDVYENYDVLKHSIGFVPQQDLLREDDTVKMTLENAAEMRLSKKYSGEERNVRVQTVLEMFGLSVQQNELVRKLSGGQRKRLSICVEFISDPKLFFLDEPDSGLDGVMARDLMENLREIANENKIVLVITHTPDRVIDLFDQVIVLAKGTQDHIGHLAFFGAVEEARKFFSKETMEEIVLAVNGTNEGGEGRADEFIEKFKAINPEERGNV